MRLRNLLLLLGIILAIAGCKDEQIIDNGNQTIFDHHKKNAQTFVLASAELDTIFGEEGTKIIIDINSLELADGGEISGNVEIHLTEYYKSTDILLANLSTSSDNQLIETGGMINLVASSNGKEVVIKKGRDIEIEFSSKEKTGMEVFHGAFENGQINWKPETKPTEINKAGFFAQDGGYPVSEEAAAEMRAASKIDSIARNNILKSTKFGWINCDRFLQFDNLTSLKVEYDTVFKPSAFLVFNEINSIMPSFYGKFNRQFINLPVGYEATLIIFCVDGEKTYFSSRKFVIQDKKEIMVEFKETSLDKIKVEIEKMIEKND